ncbi:MAG: hypothetical protein AAGU19_04125 [Prolixibacteraceae bacterium]
MENINQIFQLSRIIAKMKSGEMRDFETEYLNEWLRQSTENERILNKILNEENRNKREDLFKQIDLEKAWKKSFIKIEQEKRISFIRIYKYAAAILLPLTILTLVFFREYRPETKRTEKLVQIVPGSKNARLILNNGKSISLDDSNVLELKEQDGTTIKKENDLLTYEKADEHERSGKPLNNVLETPRGGEYNLVLADGSKEFKNR